MDAANNPHNCTIDIVITDNEAAIAVCQAATIAIDEFGDASLLPSDIDGGSSDNCGVFTLSIDIDSFDCYELGDHIVSLTATDNLGQATTCTATVSVTGPDADCDQVADLCDLCPGGDDQVDNNNDGLPDCAYFPGLENLIEDWKCGKKNKKVEICHIPGGDYSKRKTICVTPSSLAAHLAHGDFIGGCDNITCDPPANLTQQEQDQLHNRGGVFGNTVPDLTRSVSVYPNPTIGLVYLDLKGFADQKTHLRIIDTHGQIIVQRSLGSIDSQIETLHLEALPAGVYQLLIQTDDGQSMAKRIVLQR